jgi:nitrite reductase/ring-hydroxylating ferredoxin subunit
MLTVGTGAYLGGHLSYRLATGVSHSQTEQHALPEGWQDLGKVADFPDGARVCRLIGDVPVLVIRHGDRVTVLLDRCAHLGGPLHSGEPALVDGQDCVVCPWHGSIYRVADGAVLRGPATAPQSRLDVRLENGRVRARRPG